MKILKRLLIIILILSIAIVLSGGIYFKYFGRDFVQLVLNNTLKRNVMISNMSYQFPFGMNMSYVSFESILFSKKMIIQVDPLSVLTKRIKLSSVILVEPVVNIVKEEGEKGYSLKQIPADMPQAPGNKEIITLKKEKNRKFDVLINKFIVVRGISKYSNGEFSFELKDIHLQANDVLFPVGDSDMNFNISAVLSGQDNFLLNSSMLASGKINIFKKNLDANIALTKNNKVDVLSAKLLSKNNDMSVEGEINSSSNFSEKGKEARESSSPADLFLDKLSLSGLKIKARFFFKTNMDDFKIEKVKFEGNVVSN